MSRTHEPNGAAPAPGARWGHTSARGRCCITLNVKAPRALGLHRLKAVWETLQAASGISWNVCHISLVHILRGPRSRALRQRRQELEQLRLCIIGEPTRLPPAGRPAMSQST